MATYTIPSVVMPSGHSWTQDVPVTIPEWPLLLMLRTSVKDTLGLDFSGSMIDLGRKVREYYLSWMCVLSPVYLVKIEAWLRVFDAACPPKFNTPGRHSRPLDVGQRGFTL